MKKTTHPLITVLEAKANIEIGLKFKHYGYLKQGSIWTITDVLTTTNSKGEIVNVEYSTEHVFCGQTICSTVNKITILRSYVI